LSDELLVYNKEFVWTTEATTLCTMIAIIAMIAIILAGLKPVRGQVSDRLVS